MKKIFPEIEVNESTFQVEINLSDLSIDPDKISSAIGYNDGEIPKHFAEVIHEIIAQTPKKCEVKSGYRILNLSFAKENPYGLKIGNEHFSMDRIVTSQLRKANKAAIFLCSIGSQMEKWSKNLMKDENSLMGYLVDLTASNVVENVANVLHDHIGAKSEKIGFNITNRYSPGYCNWSVKEQQKLFSFLPKEFCNVKLSNTSLMFPIKSISGVIGIGKNVKFAEYICDRCGVKDCTHRIYLQSKNL